MKSSDNVGVTFVNAVTGRGVLNGVVNVQLGVFEFGSDGKGEVNGDLSVACRLRMDAKCAEDLRNHLNDILALIDEAKARSAVAGVVADGAEASERPNGKGH